MSTLLFLPLLATWVCRSGRYDHSCDLAAPSLGAACECRQRADRDAVLATYPLPGCAVRVPSEIARDVSGGWYLDRLDHPVRRVADVSSGNCPAWDCFWRSSPAYMEQAMERGQLARSMAGLVFSNHRPHDRCRDSDDSFRFDHAIALQLVPPRLHKHTHGVGS